MPGLLDPRPLDLQRALRHLRELQARRNQLLGATFALTLAAMCAFALGRDDVGFPILIGAATALGLAALRVTDRHRLLVRMVAQGDAGTLEVVRDAGRKLCSEPQRRRLARGLRAAAEAGEPGAMVSMMVHPARAHDVGDRLVSLADGFADPLTQISGQAAALCSRLLCDAQHSPLFNPHVPATELIRVLDLLERDLEHRPARR